MKSRIFLIIAVLLITPCIWSEETSNKQDTELQAVQKVAAVQCMKNHKDEHNDQVQEESNN